MKLFYQKDVKHCGKNAIKYKSGIKVTIYYDAENDTQEYPSGWDSGWMNVAGGWKANRCTWKDYSEE